ncbi:L,D-transpeptidase family protein [Paracoccus halophilus]|nr:L,D-transpeptidase family protein [Paracoccus halophilus]
MVIATVAACGGDGNRSSVSTSGSKFRSYSGPPVTQVVIKKGDRKLYLISGKTPIKTYKIGLGNEPVGTKRYEGDGKTPEGLYFIDRFNPNSRYHLSVGISYPSPQDVAQATAIGKRPGGDIFIHGLGPEGRVLSKEKQDWTAGCIAIDDGEIEEVYAMLKPGVPIFIYP